MAVRSVAESANQAPIVVPHLVTDPRASLRPTSIQIRLGGWMWEIPALPAADWLDVLMVGASLSLDDVFPGLLDQEERNQIEDALMEGRVDLNAMYEATMEAISMAAGRPWWTAIQLIETARDQWNVLGGRLILKGVDAERLSLSAWLDALMTSIIDNMDRSKLPMYLAHLETPPKGIEKSQEEVEMDRNQFFAMM